MIWEVDHFTNAHQLMMLESIKHSSLYNMELENVGKVKVQSQLAHNELV